jgi:phosphoribosylanthranilate isomerase
MRVKICGLTSVDDALMTAEAGADWIGLNFYPASPRFVEDGVAREIVDVLPGGATAVGLFVNSPTDRLAEKAERLGLRIVQLHGHEPPEQIAELAHLKVIRAFRLDDLSAIDSMMAYLDRCGELGRLPDAVLVDGHAAGSLGGTGIPIADHLLSRLPSVERLILAGGLNAENVADRIRKVRPWMVDVASGVESAPGRKDPDRVKRFIKLARSALAE